MEMPKQQEQVVRHLREALAVIPPDAPTAVVLRHAERPRNIRGNSGNDLLLTERGERHSQEFGEVVRGRVSSVQHSPVPRCRQSAERIAAASGCGAVAESLALRSDAFVADFQKAADTTLVRLVREDGFYDEFVNTMSASDKPPYPHFLRPAEGAARLVAGLLGGQMRIGVTHDWLVNVTLSHARGRPIARSEFAGFLDSVLIWQEAARYHYYYKGEHGACAPVFQRALRRALNPGNGGG